MEEFQEAQANFSHVIVPFCESNGLEVPAALAEYRKAEKKKKEKKRMEDALKRSNGVANGHAVKLETRGFAELEGDSSRLLSMNPEEAPVNETAFDANGTVEYVTTTGENLNDSDDVISVQAVNGERTSAPSEGISKSMELYFQLIYLYHSVAWCCCFVSIAIYLQFYMGRV